MSAPLTPSGEVAVFVDDDQFGFGQSPDKCGPEAVAVFWHSVKVGEKNTYTPAEVHQMAHDDYQRFIGPDTAADTNGTSNETLYAMLKFHGFTFFQGPTDIDWVQDWLTAGYPVIIGMQESSVHDLDLHGACPYSWNVAGLNHVVVATGPGAAGELLCRDTASIAPTGLRGGPRRYDTTKLVLVSATMVVPSWLPVPSSANPPDQTPPPPPPVDWKKEAQTALVQLEAGVKALADALAHW